MVTDGYCTLKLYRNLAAMPLGSTLCYKLSLASGWQIEQQPFFPSAAVAQVGPSQGILPHLSLGDPSGGNFFPFCVASFHLMHVSVHLCPQTGSLLFRLLFLVLASS